MDNGQDDAVRGEGPLRESAGKIKRTYGRKKESNDVLGDVPLHLAAPYQTRCETAEGSKALGCIHISQLPAGDASNAFGWKEKLALIDKQFDEAESQGPNKSSDRDTNDHATKDSSSMQSASTEDDSFGLHDETLLSASIPPPSSSQSDPPSSGAIDASDEKTKPSLAKSRAPLSGMPGVTSSRLNSSKLPKAPSTVLSSSEDEDVLQPNAGRDSVLEAAKELLNERTVTDGRPKVRKASTRKPKEQANGIKKLSKKEEKESKKAHARIMADQEVSITKRAEQYTVELLLKSVQKKQLLFETKSQAVSSDPIQEFTSSPMYNSMDAPIDAESRAGPSGLQDTSDDDMPAMNDLLERDGKERQEQEADAQRKKGLALAKRRALESIKAQAVQSDSEDDDLEVVGNANGNDSKRDRHATAYEKRLASVARFRAGTAGHLFVEGSQGDRTLETAAKSVFLNPETRRTKVALDHRDLQAAMLSKATKQSMQITREKEEEWRQRGGKLAGKQRAVLANEPLSLDHLAQELAQTRQKHEILQEGTDDTVLDTEGDSDEDWQPHERGSASPASHKSARGSDEDEDESEASERELADQENVSHMQQVDVEVGDDLVKRRRQPRHSKNLVIVSDSEGEEPDGRQASGRVLVPDTSMVINDQTRRSTISSESGLDEDNKENDTPLPLDSGDDKENTMIISRSTPTRPGGLRSRQSSRVFSLEDRTRQLSMSPSADVGNDEFCGARRPLQTRKLSTLDEPFALRSPSSATSFGTPKSNRAPSAVGSPISLRPRFEGGASGLTQIFNDDEGVALSEKGIHSTSLLQPAFHLQVDAIGGDSPHRPSNAPKPVKLGSLSDAFSSEMEGGHYMSRSKHFDKNDELSLTLDTRLQPALDVPTQIRRKADAVFEKEQDFVVEEACTSATSSRSKQELYVSENGLLTQTRPEGSTPVVYRSWTQSKNSVPTDAQPTTLPANMTQRLPLSTLSLQTGNSSPSDHRLNRLIKGKERAMVQEEEGDILASSSLPGRPASAFTKLLEGAKRQKTKERRNLGKSNFIEGEAQESDEDELFGFGGPKTKEADDESEEDDPDAVVENLLDDTAMDSEQLAEERVLEKVKEQIEEDDAALQKYHQAVVEGKYRGKRRGGGIAMSDSESDENEDEDARRLRRRLHKKRRIQGDKLEDLGKDENSRAFYEAYQRDVQDEDNEDFAHLAGDDMDMEDNIDENEQPETVSTTEIQEQLREIARQQKGKEKIRQQQQERPFDSEGVDRADSLGTSDDEFNVKEVDDRPKRAAPRRPVFGQLDIPDFDDSLPRKSSKSGEEKAAQLAAWRKEQSGRNFGTGGMRGAITVTGHTSNNSGRVESSSRVTASRAKSGGQPVRRKVSKTASILASVADRHSRFGL